MKWTAVVLVTLSATFLSGCNPAATVADLLGQAAARRVAPLLPSPAAATKIEARGGDWCGVMEARGWPARARALTSNAEFVFILDYGERHCGWRPPGVPVA